MNNILLKIFGIIMAVLILILAIIIIKYEIGVYGKYEDLSINAKITSKIYDEEKGITYLYSDSNNFYFYDKHIDILKLINIGDSIVKKSGEKKLLIYVNSKVDSLIVFND